MTAQSGQGARDRHGQCRGRADAHAGRSRRRGVGAHGTQPESDRAPGEDPPDERGGAHRDHDAEVALDAGAEDVGQPSGALDGLAGLRIVRRVETVERQQVEQAERRDVVQHDRGDDLVGAGARFEESGDEAPHRAAEETGEHRDYEVHERRQRPGEPDIAGRGRAGDDLTLAAYVEQPGAEREGDAEAGEDQRCRGEDRAGDRARDAAGRRRCGS